MSNKHVFSPGDLGKLSEDDRMAVMKMVKEKELTIEEAMAMVMGEARQRTMTVGKKFRSVIGMRSKPKKGEIGFQRRGAMKKNRGRLHIELMAQKASAFSVLILRIVEGRDLLAMNKDGVSSDPFCKVFLMPDPKKESKKKTAVRKNTRNPNFNEQFTWEIRSGTDLDSYRLHITLWNHGSWRSNKFLGSMSFSLAEVFDDDTPTTGWFKVLDQKKGEFQNQPYRVMKKAAAGADKAPPKPGKNPAKDRKSSIQQQPLPKVPAAAKPADAPKGNKAKPAAAAAQPTERLTVDSFRYLKVLGQGSFGKVLLAEKTKNPDEVFAIKVLSKDRVVEDDDVECTMTERRVLSLGSNCPFLTNLAATFQTPERLYFVMEFVNGGDLMFHIQKLKRFPEAQAIFYSAEICLGLWYLHKHGVLYRDLKLDNVMLDHEGHIKIADFGMCKENIWGSGTTTTFCGTPGYLAPEIIQELPYGGSVDWWSLGVLTYEMLCGESPFEGDDEEELFKQILEHSVSYPRGMTSLAKSFVSGLLTRNPQQRLGCGRNGKADLMAHPFLSSIDWAKLENREIKPPYQPTSGGPKEASNFDEEFTELELDLTPVDQDAIDQMQDGLFRDFTYVGTKFGGETAAGDADEPAPPTGSALSGYSWYRPDLQRGEAEKLLQGKEAGVFYVRESASQPGCYAIAMATQRGRCWNGLVTPSVTADGRTLYKLFVKHKFDSLPELIDYYCEHPVATDSSGNKLKLVKP